MRLLNPARSFALMEDRKAALKAFAKRLHDVMYEKGRGKIPAELADLLGGEVSADAISKWVADDPQEPRIYNLALVAEALNVSLDWLVFGPRKRALDVALVNEIRSLRELPDKDIASALGAQLKEDLDPWPLATELTRDIEFVTPARHKEVKDELAPILDKAGALISELKALRKQWKELRERYPSEKSQRQ